ncbi:hypothetical protein [Nostoc linckia]|uniref:hypothetical protein n=1 Tax=Nostoc linckia TaxID=92942 RepID=UPI0011810AF9|nr:hypothetical protein [Nostoc linckia]
MAWRLSSIGSMNSDARTGSDAAPSITLIRVCGRKAWTKQLNANAAPAEPKMKYPTPTSSPPTASVAA